jgi:SSU ribosomal protein S1P
VGQEVEVVLLNIDLEKQKISLGLKQLQEISGDFFHRQSW